MNGILIDELIDRIITDEELEKEDKTKLLKALVNSSFITPGFYLKKINEDTVECWYRNVDENGTMEHGNTGWTDAQDIINEYINNKENAKRR